MSTFITYDLTDDGIRLKFESDDGAYVGIPLTHEDRKALAFFLLEIPEPD